MRVRMPNLGMPTTPRDLEGGLSHPPLQLHQQLQAYSENGVSTGVEASVDKSSALFDSTEASEYPEQRQCTAEEHRALVS